MTIRVLLGLVLILVVGGPGPSAPQTRCANPPKPPNVFHATVSRVLDGDTIHVRLNSGPSERLRLIGIDTPEVHEGDKLERDVRHSGRSKAEIQALGQLAWEFSKQHLGNKQIGLEFDVQSRDGYGRLLAYAWLLDDMMFNALILREGYAQVLTVPPNVKYVELFIACQRDAREHRRGLWGR